MENSITIEPGCLEEKYFLDINCDFLKKKFRTVEELVKYIEDLLVKHFEVSAEADYLNHCFLESQKNLAEATRNLEMQQALNRTMMKEWVQHSAACEAKEFKFERGPKVYVDNSGYY